MGETMQFPLHRKPDGAVLNFLHIQIQLALGQIEEIAKRHSPEEVIHFHNLSETTRAFVSDLSRKVEK